ncbi:MAG: 4-hydroxy-3-methylbut-2-enyl diphosphate reductase [Paludibacteraceae bacterium]|nr:4-hydroxy-3-methylbut-2-enyl diphosphate reductase [Paludibacteraceae bacterium]
MIVSIDNNSGFCFGVTSAIEKAEEELAKGQLFCLGDIVHNGQEVKRLEQLGLETIDYDDLRTLHNIRVLLRAHGEPPSTYHIARNNGIEIIDATCPVVKKLQERIRKTYLEHRDAQIVIYGKAGHAEVIGLQGQTNNTAIIIESEKDLDKIELNRDIYLFSQTTMSVEGFEAIKSKVESRKSKDSIFEAHNTICKNVANRVEKLKAFAAEQDLVLFVGGRKSSNAKVLFEHCREANPNTFFIENAADLQETLSPITSNLSPSTKVGICGATSTPQWLMQEVADSLLATPVTLS